MPDPDRSLKMDELSVVLPKEVANVLILGVNI